MDALTAVRFNPPELDDEETGWADVVRQIRSLTFPPIQLPGMPK
jgi:hypothetical protein